MKRFMLIFACLLLTVGSAVAQSTQKITGKITSAETGEALLGAQVFVNGTSFGTVTDTDGKFTIKNVPTKYKQLTISYFGRETKTVPIAPIVNAALKENSKFLDEAVVVAYGTAKKSSLTGAVEKVDNEAIEKTIGSSVTGALEGAAPGVQVNNTYGEPGSDPNIRIRGVGSVNGSNAPLYVLDGNIFNGNISDLNPNDIESMTVLKDASAAALYGNRAANGVIIITSKNGKNNTKPSVTFTINQGTYSRGLPEYSRLGANEWMEAQWTALKNSRLSNPATNPAANPITEAVAAAYATANIIGDKVKNNIYDAPNNALFDANGKLTASILPGYTDLDWADALERHGHRQEYGVSFANSGDKFDVYASVGYTKEKGYIINTDFERFTARTNASFTPVDWFKGGVNISASSQVQNYNGNANGTYYANPFYVTRTEAPVYPIYLHNADGSIVTDGNGEPVYDTYSAWRSNRHIIFERNTDYERNRRLTIDAGAFATFYLPYGFSATVKGNKNYRTRHYRDYNNPLIGDGATNGGRLTYDERQYETTILDEQIDWSKEFGKHHVDALLAHESYEYNYRYGESMKTGMSLPGVMVAQNFTELAHIYGWDDVDKVESYLGRVRYNYDEKYFGEFSLRRDGSSRFSTDNRWGTFWSIGGAWDFSKENFIKDNASWIDFGKLRVSLGQVGNNQGIDYYAYQALYGLEQNGGSAALLKQQLAANDLKWETTQTFDIGIDARLFNRWNLSVGYFDKLSKDLLFSVQLPGSAGYYLWGSKYSMTQLKNIGKVSNRGWEISTDVDIYKNKDWKVNVGADITFISNKIKKLPDHEGIANGTYRRFEEGHNMYSFYTYHFEGVDQLTGNALYTIDPDKAAAAAATGKLVEINGVQYTTDADSYGKKDWAGKAMPSAYGSFNATVSWKGLSLYMLMTYSLGGKLMDTGYRTLMNTSGSSASALHKDILKSWTAADAANVTSTTDATTGETTYYNRIKGGIPVNDSYLSSYNNTVSDRFLKSASYLVMKNITLSYDFPKALISKWSLTGLTVKVGCENLFTVTSRKGINPQYGFTGAQDATYITARIFNAGLTVKF